MNTVTETAFRRAAQALVDACYQERYVQPTNPGFCYLKAGWQRDGWSKDGKKRRLFLPVGEPAP